ncbi:MAG: acyltransferase [Xanthomonadales bacterium]|nr:acyltransferase [Xanthomonadales bacterium]
MFASLPALLRVPMVLLALAISLLAHVLPLFALTLVKLLIPLRSVRRVLSRALVRIAESWIGVNNALFDLFTRVQWDIHGLEGLDRTRSYLVLCNHQSWVDIAAMQKVFNRRIPFLRFFLKQQLIWVPLLGAAWWALDFPFMRRYSSSVVLRHPELRGKDMEATRRACRKFRHVPVSMVSFAEGTRFTPAKHAAQTSPFRHLLRPRAGAVAYVLDAMGDALHGIVDVTLIYPDGPCTMLDLLLGRLHRVHVRVRALPIGEELRGDYNEDTTFRGRVKAWLNALWREKDAYMDRFDAAARGGDGTGG